MAVFTAIGASVATATGLAWLGTAVASVASIATGVVFSAIHNAMQGEPQPAKFGVQGTLQGGDDVPRSINFGWNCTAGSLVYHNTWGDGGVMSTRVIAISDAPIRELLGVEVNGVADTLGGPAHPQYGSPVLGFRKGGVDHLWIKFYDGTQTTADAFLVSQVSSADRPYSATRFGRGVPYVIVTARAPERNDGEDKPLFQGLPAYKFITNGVRLYDPSRDSTVGGVGTQRWANPATWGGDGDFLPPVQIYNLLRGIRVEGQWLYGMQATHPARVDNATFIAAINRARAVTPGTAEPTFRAGGEAQVGAPVHLTIEALVTACNGRLVEAGGTYKLYVGEPGEPVMSFTDGDILSTEEQTFSPFLSLADTINGVAATYPNPAEGWNVKTAPTLLRPDLEVLDGNRRLLASVSLDFVPYPGQVQRLMKWALGEALRARRHTLVLGPEFRVIEPGDVVRWSSLRNGYIDKLFRVDGAIYRSNLDVIVDLTEVDPADYDWNQATDYRPVVDGPLNLVGPRPMPMTGWQVFPAEIRDEQGRARRPSIEVWTASGVPGVDGVRVQVRVGDEAGPLIFDSPPLPYGDPWKWVLQGQFPADVACVVRGIFVGPPNAEWSGWLAVKTPDIRLSALDVIYGDLDIDELGDQVEGLFGWVGMNVRELWEEAQAQANLTADQELANAGQFDQMRRSLGTAIGTLSATFEETVTTAILPMNGKLVALADALTELSAGDGDDVSTARLRMTAMSGPDGYGRIAVETRSNNTDPNDWRGAGTFWDTPADPALPTRIVNRASQFILVSDDESAAFEPFIFENGEAKMMAARIGTIRSGRLQSFDGKFIIDLDLKRISIST